MDGVVIEEKIQTQKSYCGVAKIKDEFLVRNSAKASNNFEKSKNVDETPKNGADFDKEKPENEADLGKDNPENAKDLDKDKKKDESTDEPAKKKARYRGQNKKRPRDQRIASDLRLCVAALNGAVCRFGDKCRFSHDIHSYWSSKPEDFPGVCPNFETYGKCKHGLACRFAKTHVDSDLKNLENAEKIEESSKLGPSETNLLTDDLRKLLIKKAAYDYTKSENYLKTIVKDDKIECVVEDVVEKEARKTKTLMKNWAGKLILAPLTTVGNLPFRRVCVDYGADITCGEMAMATELLQGHKSEWALVRRHKSEKIFGVQICGAHPDTMTKCAQLLTETTDVDFIDVNMGCPIDLVCSKGAGCMLMSRAKRLEDIVNGMNTVMGDVPLTIKIRTGVYESKNVAHILAPKFEKLNISSFTIHGRSKEQRYTKLPDWSYIDQCAKAADPVPCFGCGDVLSYEDYYDHLENSSVSGIVLARGALIKPWIFTEIKERRHWDIRSSERLDILRTYANYGLEHWGSDQQGVDITRRFLLEWISFLHRYIPIGLLERIPQKINERPPPFFGRDDLETIMASGNCRDWIKLSEMLLGPVSDSFQFLPKHKANSYQ